MRRSCKDVPPPGSATAAGCGCTCPRMDNHYGAGRSHPNGPQFVISEDCPLHVGWSPPPQLSVINGGKQEGECPAVPDEFKG